MPIFEFQCRKCRAVTEVLCYGGDVEDRAVNCGHCGSRATTKVISRTTFSFAKAAKYSEEFMHNARQFLRAQKQTAEYFAEGKGSEDGKTFRLAEQIGERIDRTLATHLPTRKR